MSWGHIRQMQIKSPTNEHESVNGPHQRILNNKEEILDLQRLLV